MRNLPHNQTLQHKLMIATAKDFFGDCPNLMKKVRPVALWLMNRKKRIKLDKEQEDAVWHCRTNLADTAYRQSLLDTLKR